MDEILREMNEMRIDELEQLILRAQLLVEKKREDEKERCLKERLLAEQERQKREKERHEEMEKLERRLNELRNEEAKEKEEAEAEEKAEAKAEAQEFRCPQCGKVIAPDSRFCCFCGKVIKYGFPQNS